MLGGDPYKYFHSVKLIRSSETKGPSHLRQSPSPLLGFSQQWQGTELAA